MAEAKKKLAEDYQYTGVFRELVEGISYDLESEDKLELEHQYIFVLTGDIPFFTPCTSLSPLPLSFLPSLFSNALLKHVSDRHAKGTCKHPLDRHELILACRVVSSSSMPILGFDCINVRISLRFSNSLQYYSTVDLSHEIYDREN